MPVVFLLPRLTKENGWFSPLHRWCTRTIHVLRKFALYFSPFSCCFAVFSRQMQYNWIVYLQKLLKTCACLWNSPFPLILLRSRFKRKFAEYNSFRGFTNRNQNCKSLHSSSTGTRLYHMQISFRTFVNLVILITSLPLFFNRSLEEGKMSYMAIRDARFTHTVFLWVNYYQ